MTSREEKRKNLRRLQKIALDAKTDTLNWLLSLGHDPTEEEIKAFKAGYLAGANRFNK